MWGPESPPSSLSVVACVKSNANVPPPGGACCNVLTSGGVRRLSHLPMRYFDGCRSECEVVGIF